MNIKNFYKNNINFALVTKPGTSLCIVHISADLGIITSAKDSATRALFCDLLMSGAGEWSRTKFLDEINKNGGSIGISEDEGKININLETISERLPKILSLLKLMLTKPIFSNQEITRAKTTYHQELNLETEQARVMAHIKLFQSLYQTSERPYQYLPQEKQTVSKSVKRNEFKLLHKRLLLSPWSVTIGSNQTNITKIIKVIASLKKTEYKVIPTQDIDNQVINLSKSGLTTYQISTQQNIEVAIGQRLNLTLKHPDYPAVLFALAVLGKWGGFSGRLMSTVREKQGLTYGIYAKAEMLTKNETGNWRIMTFFHPNDLEKGIYSTLREINKLYRYGITEAELVRFKTIIKTSHSLLFDSLISLTTMVHTYNAKQLNFSDYENMLSQMQKLNRQAINRVIKAYLNPDLLQYSLAGNLADYNYQLKKLLSTLKIN